MQPKVFDNGDGDKVVAGNRDVIERLAQSLSQRFEEFINEEHRRAGGLNYVDALMGCHNFYKRLILDLEHRTGSMLPREVAVDCLQRAMAVAPPPPQPEERN